MPLTLTALFIAQGAEIRFTQSILDSVSFGAQTVHDDEKDHRSQHFRRYGHGMSSHQRPLHVFHLTSLKSLTTHSILFYFVVFYVACLSVCLSYSGFDLCVIEDLCRVGAAVASARCAIHVGGLQHLSDCMAQRSGVSKGHTRRLGQLLPSYLLALLKWSESESENDGEVEGSLGQGQREQSSSSRRYQGRGQGKDDPYKAFIRTKLDRVSQIFQSSKYLADTAPIGSINAEETGAAEVGVGGREIVGETSGQLIPSTAPTANLPSSKVLRTSLVRQMEKLTDSLRLLAGPLGDKEEMEDTSEAEGGDSLTRLRMKLRSDPGCVGHVPLDQFNPDEFEKEEKMNFVVTDYIEEEETATEAADVSRGKRQRVRRDLPIIRLTESEGYRLKRELRESCGVESPISRLSVRALIDLLSYRDTYGPSTDTYDTGTDTGKIEAADRINIVGGIETAHRSSGTDPTSGDIDPATQKDDQIRRSSSTSSNDRDSGSDSVGSNSNDSKGEGEGASRSGAGITAVKDPISVPVPVPVPPSQFLSDFLAVQSALRSPGSGSGAQVLTAELSTDPTVESRISSTGSTSARKAGVEGDVVAQRGNGFAIKGDKVSASRAIPQSHTTGDIDRKNVKDDPAAMHRRKIKQRLAALSSSGGNPVSDRENTGERRNEGALDSSTIAERSQLEEQTDTLARLVEQRIHDRWMQAAIPPTPPHPFR
jgi:hypothetical protein